MKHCVEYCNLSKLQPLLPTKHLCHYLPIAGFLVKVKCSNPGQSRVSLPEIDIGFSENGRVFSGDKAVV